MKRTLHAITFTSVLAMLSACATAPDPAEICSADWIAPRTTKAISSIEKRAKSSLGTFTKASETLAEGKMPGLLQTIALTSAISKMKKELTQGQGIRDLKTVAKTCNNPTLIKDSMHDLLQRQGVSDGAIQWIENNPIYEGLIASLSAPDPVSASR